MLRPLAVFIWLRLKSIDLAEAEGADARVRETLGAKLQVFNIGSSWGELEERGTAAATHSPVAMSPFEIISNYLQYVTDPVFAAQQQATTGSATENAPEEDTFASNRNIVAARKKLTELLVSVKQVQQNVEVPLVQLIVDPVIHDFVAKCKAEGKKFSPEDFVSEVTDPSIMNQLQAGVNKWIKDTQKVVKIDR